ESSSAAAARPTGGLRVDYGFVATVDREIMRDPEREAGYGITDSWDEIVETLQGAPVSTDMKLGGYVREFETRVRQDMDEIYMRLDDEQTERQLLAGRLNMLFKDRHASDLVHGEVMSLRTTILGQMSEIRELQAADRRRQTVISELLRIDHRRSTEITELRTALQGQVTALQGQVKGTDLASYTQRFQELALLCGRMFSEESDKIENFFGGLPDMIHGSVVVSKPKTMQEAIEITTELMNKKIRTFAERE
nr:reverse transcriptase domain-containing protein [Tanacetum cinerariifolium]